MPLGDGAFIILLQLAYAFGGIVRISYFVIGLGRAVLTNAINIALIIPTDFRPAFADAQLAIFRIAALPRRTWLTHTTFHTPALALGAV